MQGFNFIKEKNGMLKVKCCICFQKLVGINHGYRGNSSQNISPPLNYRRLKHCHSDQVGCFLLTFVLWRVVGVFITIGTTGRTIWEKSKLSETI